MQGVSRGREYCDDNFPGEEGEDIYKRIDCYDKNEVYSIEICSIKADFYYWTNLKLQRCFKNLGYVLNKDFCISLFPLISQID